MRKETFIKAAEEIVLAYPGEREGIYFVPGKQKTNTTPRTQNQGKLWSRYNNLKTKLGKFQEVEINDLPAEKGTLRNLYFMIFVLKVSNVYSN